MPAIATCSRESTYPPRTRPIRARRLRPSGVSVPPELSEPLSADSAILGKALWEPQLSRVVAGLAYFRVRLPSVCALSVRDWREALLQAAGQGRVSDSAEMPRRNAASATALPSMRQSW